MAAMVEVALVLSVVETAQQMQLQIKVAAVAVLRPDALAMADVVVLELSLCDTQRL